jgi:hypothetical protein
MLTSPNPVCFVECRICTHREKISRLAFARRTRPRCTACGAMVDPVESDKEDHVAARTHARRNRLPHLAV